MSSRDLSSRRAATAEAERIEQLAEVYYETERLQRRREGQRERLLDYYDECAELDRELVQARRRERRLRFGLEALSRAILGDRAELLHEARRELERLARRRELREQ